MKPTDPGVITIRQASDWLHIKPWTVYHLLDNGIIGCFWTHDNRRLVDEYDVISYYACYECD
jgi:hypothetical protein